MTANKHFVFLVFNDPVVVGAIEFLTAVINEARLSSAPHLTIQGPLSEKASLDSIASIKKKLQDDILFIGNPGIFETNKGVALFLRVNSANLEKVWHKPDFPVARYGFNPHITLYEGLDAGRAKRAFEVLKRNRIELLCRDYDIVQYVPKQVDMFPAQSVRGDEHAISILVGQGRLSASFRASYMEAVNRIE